MRAIDRPGIDKQDLRHMSAADLARLGVRLTDRKELILQCERCGETWTPQLDAGGKLPFDYWLCPAKCNEMS
ncbi:MAG: hypothetical protein JST11_04610 [Acidobacteria bacterium]|nr:hypothetical protein [Acidobacteriota bacterium]